MAEILRFQEPRLHATNSPRSRGYALKRLGDGSGSKRKFWNTAKPSALRWKGIAPLRAQDHPAVLQLLNWRKMEYKQVPVAEKPPLDEKLQSRLGDQLKRLFAETALTPIPERFAILLDQLELVGVEGLRPTEKVHADLGGQ